MNASKKNSAVTVEDILRKENYILSQVLTRLRKESSDMVSVSGTKKYNSKKRA